MKLLDFKFKPWEALGIWSDNKGGWNHGFFPGFHHLVYSLIGMGILMLVLPEYIRKSQYGLGIALWIYTGVMTLWFFLNEIWQAYGMRTKQVWHYWRFWEWHQGRHWDYLTPAIGLSFVLFVRGVI